MTPHGSSESATQAAINAPYADAPQPLRPATRLLQTPDTLTVAALETTVFRLPMEGVLRWGKSSTMAEVRHVLVEVHLSDGSSGVAEAPPRPTIYGETAATIVAILRDEVAPRLVGRPVHAAGALLAEVRNNHTARAAVDMALHEAAAQSAGLSLPDWLGSRRERLPVSYILGIGAPDEVLAEAQRMVDLGVRVLKVKVGRSWEADLAQIDRLRAALGAKVALYADANEMLTPAQAPTILAALRARGLLYCEEPLPVEMVHERAALRRAAHIPLIADDSCFTERDLRRELALDTFDILNIKTARTGYSESARMMAGALAAGKGIMLGSQAGAGVGTARCALFAALPGIDHPSELSFYLRLREDIVATRPALQDGALLLADAARMTLDRSLLRDAAVAI
jgi:L-alanine-DL-glutamate epimerase-like enolase superfamily enzyme